MNHFPIYIYNDKDTLFSAAIKNTVSNKRQL